MKTVERYTIEEWKAGEKAQSFAYPDDAYAPPSPNEGYAFAAWLIKMYPAVNDQNFQRSYTIWFDA